MASLGSNEREERSVQCILSPRGQGRAKAPLVPAPVKVPFQMILEQKGVTGKVKERAGKEEDCKKELM